MRPLAGPASASIFLFRSFLYYSGLRTRVSHGARLLAPGSLTRRRLARNDGFFIITTRVTSRMGRPHNPQPSTARSDERRTDEWPTWFHFRLSVRWPGACQRNGMGGFIAPFVFLFLGAERGGRAGGAGYATCGALARAQRRVQILSTCSTGVAEIRIAIPTWRF